MVLFKKKHPNISTTRDCYHPNASRFILKIVERKQKQSCFGWFGFKEGFFPVQKKIREPNEQGNDNNKKIVRHLVLYTTFTRQKRKEEKEQK